MLANFKNKVQTDSTAFADDIANNDNRIVADSIRLNNAVLSSSNLEQRFEADSILQDQDSIRLDNFITQYDLDTTAIGNRIDNNETAVANETLNRQTADGNLNTRIVNDSTNLANHIAADGDLDASNETNTNFQVNGANLEITDADGTLQVPLSNLNTSTDDQNLSVTSDSILIQDGTGAYIGDIRDTMTSHNTRLLNSATKINNNETAISNETLNRQTSDGNLSTRIVNDSTNLANHIAADGDLDASNETNTNFQVNGANLEITDADGTLQVPLSNLNTSSDDQNLSVTADSILIEDGRGAYIGDIRDTLTSHDNRINNVRSQSNANFNLISNVDAKADANSTRITNDSTRLQNHIAADGDLDASNETNTNFQVNGANLEITDADGTLQVPLSNLNTSSDDQNLSITSDSILIQDGTGAYIGDIRDTLTSHDNRINNVQSQSNANFNLISNVDAKADANSTRITNDSTRLQNHIAADGDLDASNETNTNFQVNGANLEITDADGTLQVPLNSISTDDQNLTISTGKGTIRIEDGNQVILNDSSSTNELQDLDINGTNDSLLISGGQGIAIADLGISDDDDWANSGSNNSVVETSRNTSVGNNNTFTTSTQNAFSAGSSNTNQGTNSVALGNNITITGDNSINMGLRNNSSGIRAQTLGSWIVSTGSDAITIGGGYDGTVLFNNNLDSTIMFGYRSNLPTMTIRPANGLGTIGKVGIGTTTPDSLLTVAGGIHADAIRLTDGAGAGRVLVSDGQGNASWTNFSNNILRGAGATNKLAFFAAPDSVTFSNKLHWDNVNERLGIGMTSPSAKLCVWDTVTGAQGIGINSYLFSSSSNNLYGLKTSVEHTNASSDTAFGLHANVYGSAGSITKYGVYSRAYGGAFADYYGLYAYGAGQNRSYGIRTEANGSGNVNYGIFSSANGTATNNWAAWFDEGNVYIKGALSLDSTASMDIDAGLTSSGTITGFTSNISNGTGTLNTVGADFTAAGGGLGSNVGVIGTAANNRGENLGGEFIGTSFGTGEATGAYGEANGSGVVNYGIYGHATGATTNWAGYFESGNVYVQDSLILNRPFRLSSGAINNWVLSSDANGVATWTDPNTLVSGDGNGIFSGSGSLSTSTEVIGGANTLAFTSSLQNAVLFDTTTLVIDALNNRVGIGSATLISKFTVNDNTSINSGGYQAATFYSAGTNNSAAFQRAVGAQIQGTDGINTALFGASDGNSAGDNRGIAGQAQNGTTNTGVRGYGGATPAGVNFAFGVYGTAPETSDGINYGIYGTASNSSFINRGVVGVISGTVTTNDAAVYGIANGAGQNISLYGRSRFGNTGGVNYGLYTEASGADTNYAAYFSDGLVYIQDTLWIPTGAQNNYVLTSDANGKSSWTDPNTLVSGDNLGNHTATANIQTNGNYISNDGDNEGLFVSTTGNVGIGTNAPTATNGGLKVLEIEGGVPQIILDDTGGGATDDFSITNGGRTVDFRNSTDGDYIMRLDLLTNRVGIGDFTSLNPSQTLDVIGTTTTDTLNINSAYTLPSVAGSPDEVLKYNAAGTALEWGSAVGDNLGNHTATSNIQLNNNYLSNDGDNEGIRIDNSGFIGLGTSVNTNARVAINETSVGQGLSVIQQNNSATRSAIKGDIRGANGTEIYALEGEATSTGANNYGLHAIATGAGTTNYGVFGKALGATTNWAGYFDEGDVFILDTLRLNNPFTLTDNAAVGRVLASDANGVATWQDPNTLINGDNLGNHTATTNIQLGNNYLSNDGDNEGVSVNPSGEVSISSTTGTSLTIAKATESLLMEMQSYGSGNNAGTFFDLYNARGNATTKTAVQDGDRLFTMKSRAYYDATNIVNNELSTISVDGTVSTNIVPTRTDFKTVAANGVSNTRLTLRSNGKVGIGETDPDSTLTVNGGIKTTNFTMTNGAALNRVLTSDANGVASWTDGSFISPWSTIADTVYTLNNYIGVNTNSPDALMSIANTNLSDFGLEVVTNKTTANNIIGIFGGATGTGTGQKYGGWFSSEASGGTQNVGAYSIVQNANTNNIGFWGDGRTTVGQEARGLMGESSGGGQNIGVFAKASGGTANWAGYFESGRVYIQDSLGIGVANPSYPFHLGSTGNTTGRIDAGTNNRAALQFAETAGSFGTTATGFEVSYNGANDKLEFRSASGGSSIDTVMILDRSTGYVGINNYNPLARLDVDGAIKVNAAGAAPTQGMIQWTGSDFQGYDGTSWVSLTASNSTCPAGMTAVGGNMCIETTERSTSNWFDAAATCVAAGYKLPTWAEWYGAMATASLTDETDDWEWVSDGTSNTVRKVGNGGLKNTANDNPDSGSEVFRCVYYLK